MSIPATNWVWSQTVGNSNRKLVLLKFADHAHDDGTAAYCGIPKVAKFAECDERTAKRHVKWLYEHGYLTEGDQELVSHFPTNKRPIVYNLAMSEQVRAEWEVLNTAGGATRREHATAAGKKGAEKRAANRAASAQVSGGDNLSPQDIASTPPVGGDKMSPQDGGDSTVQSGVTDQPVGGDTGVTQTTQEPSLGTTHFPTATPTVGSPAAAGSTAPPDGGRQRGTRIPEDFARNHITAEMVEWARTTCPSVDGRAVTEAFVDHWKAVPGQRGLKLDWPATWRNWLRTEEGRNASRRPGSSRTAAYRDESVWGNQPGGQEPMSEEEADRVFGTGATPPVSDEVAG